MQNEPNFRFFPAIIERDTRAPIPATPNLTALRMSYKGRLPLRHVFAARNGLLRGMDWTEYQKACFDL
jgi:hypothetical protein